MMEKTTPIQVEESEQLANEEEGEQVQVWEIAQQIEQMVEAIYMELEQEPQDQDVGFNPVQKLHAYEFYNTENKQCKSITHIHRDFPWIPKLGLPT